MSQRTLASTLAIATLIAIVAYPIVTLLLGFQLDGYSPVRDHISELGQSGLPTAGALQGVLILDGLLVFALAWAVHHQVGDSARHPWGPRLVALFGVALVIGGLFPCDANCRPTTFAGAIHVLNVLPSAVATIGAPFAMARRFGSDPRLPWARTLALALGGLSVAAIVAAFGVFPALDMEGFGQRVVLTFQLSFYGLVALSLLHVTASGGPSEPATSSPVAPKLRRRGPELASPREVVSR